jgi:hypothetical protein
MRQLKNLDISKSIESKKLIFEEGWFDKFDTFTNYFAFLALICFSVVCFKELDSSRDNGLEYFILSLVFCFSLYMAYCKFTEKHLKEIEFTIHKEEAKQRILEYGKKYNYRISKISNNLIFLNEPINDLSPGNCEKTTIIFFKENSIFYTLIREGFKLNGPVLISQHITRMDLKKLLNLKKKLN